MGGGRTGQSGADGITRFIYQYTGVVVESDVASIFPLLFLVGSYYHGVSDIPSLDLVRDTQSRTARTFLAEGTLFLDNDDNAIT